jgi:hypothetical protein
MLHLNRSKSKRSQKVIWLNENKEEYLRGAILPIIAVSGTITRYNINTVTAGGHARAHDPRMDIMPMSMTPDLGIIAPLKMPCA